MRLIILVLTLMMLLSCRSEKINTINQSNNRVEILGREFSNSDVKSIEIVEIEHPMFGGIIQIINIPENKEVKFLTDFDNLKKKGMCKCGAKYVIRLNMENDTLRLKVCGSVVANRFDDVCYELKSGKSIIEDYINTK